MLLLARTILRKQSHIVWCGWLWVQGGCPPFNTRETPKKGAGAHCKEGKRVRALEPLIGIEPMTSCLQDRRSTN